MLLDNGFLILVLTGHIFALTESAQYITIFGCNYVILHKNTILVTMSCFLAGCHKSSTEMSQP